MCCTDTAPFPAPLGADSPPCTDTGKPRHGSFFANPSGRWICRFKFWIEPLVASCTGARVFLLVTVFWSRPFEGQALCFHLCGVKVRVCVFHPRWLLPEAAYLLERDISSGVPGCHQNQSSMFFGLKTQERNCCFQNGKAQNQPGGGRSWETLPKCLRVFGR